MPCDSISCRDVERTSKYKISELQAGQYMASLSQFIGYWMLLAQFNKISFQIHMTVGTARPLREKASLHRILMIKNASTIDNYSTDFGDIADLDF